jgi:rod shape-determining protein MreC
LNSKTVYCEAYLNLREESSHSLIPVKIVAKDLVSLNPFITANAGTELGVEPGMPMINSDGLVGQVILANNNYSQILPYSNSMFRVSAQVQGSRAYGIVSWSGRSDRELLLQFVPETIEVEPGQVVQTSGFGNQFPPGIPIGVVTHTEPGRGVDTQTIFLEAYTDLNTLAEAFIMEFRPDTTIHNLINEQTELF